MKIDIGFKILFTSSKILAYLVLISGVVGAIVSKDAQVLQDAFMYSCLLMGSKTITNAALEYKQGLPSNKIKEDI
jgi:hypothetical protein